MVVQRTPKPEDDKDYPGIKSYTPAESMVKDAGVDGAVMTTTPGTHFALAELALEGGKYGMSSASLLPYIYILGHILNSELGFLLLADGMLILLQPRNW